jgi:hypothetical protein
METRQSFRPRRDLIHSFPQRAFFEDEGSPGTKVREEFVPRGTRFLDEVARVVSSRCNQNLLLDFYLCWLVKWG